MELKLHTEKGEIILDNRKIMTFEYKLNNKKIILNKININKKDSGLAFIFLEKELSKKELNEIEILCKIVDNEMISLLMENTYLITGNNSGKYIFSKNIKRNKSWRISLTEKCNYRCFFCHEEGLDMGKERKDKSVEDIYELVKEGIKKNYTDITFTGGEPMIKAKNILIILDRLNKDKLNPDITIVTNGYLITDEFLEEIQRYKGRIKFNFSMHSVNKEIYQKIINPKNNDNNAFEKIVENIKKIKEIKDKKIKLKLNFVILNGLNTSLEDINNILEFGVKYKIDTIKFLELLITDKLIDLYNYYYEINGIQKLLDDKVQLVNREFRRDTYVYKDTNLKIELQKCTCQVGCSKCLLDKDVNITSELEYFPCFLLSASPIPINLKNIPEVIEKGEKIIEKFGEKYGDGSPLIISNPKYIKEKTEFYYTTKINYEKLIEEIRKAGYSLEVKRQFKEIYYKPELETKEWEENKKILKLYQNSYNTEEYLEVKQEIDFLTDLDGNFYSKVIFFNKERPKKIHDLEQYEKELEMLSFKKYIEYNWEIHMFKKGDNTISIGKNIETNKMTILSYSKIEDKNIQKKLDLKNINGSMLDFLAK